MLTDLNNLWQQTLFLKCKVKGMRDFSKTGSLSGNSLHLYRLWTWRAPFCCQGGLPLRYLGKGSSHWDPESAHTAAGASPLPPRLSALAVVDPGTSGPTLIWYCCSYIGLRRGRSKEASLLQLPPPLLDYQSETPQGFVNWNKKPWHKSSVWSLLWEPYWALSNFSEEGGIRLYMNFGGGRLRKTYTCA